jgi:hypothetical protein
MRDPRVFGLLEDHPPRDDSSDGQPHPMSETTLAADAVNRYGSLLRDIQTSDLAKCSCLRVLPSAHFSQSMPLRRLSLELKHFLTDHLSYITVAPIEDNLVRIIYLYPQRYYWD